MRLGTQEVLWGLGSPTRRVIYRIAGSDWIRADDWMLVACGLFKKRTYILAFSYLLEDVEPGG